MSNIFQTKEWSEFKIKSGYEKYYEIDGIFVLQKKLPGKKTMLYSPMVSEQQLAGITNNELGIKNEFLEKIYEIGKINKSIFYRLELDVPVRNTEYGIRNTFQKAFEEMQPEHTLIIDISAEVETILANMKQKGRYNIKIAKKSGIKILKNKSVDGFYQLYTTMANRNKITYRSKAYFQNLIDFLAPNGYCEVFEAYIGNQVSVTSDQFLTDNRQLTTDKQLLATAIVTYYGDRATYLFGGSSNEHRDLKAPSLLQYEIILDAKQRGCKEYDLFGIAPNDDENHPWSGVTKFKKQFGGQEVQLLGSYDLVFKPLEYKLFKLAEKIRR